MEKIFVVKQLAKKLWATEAAVDAALVEASELNRDIIQSRKDLNVSPLFAGEINVKLLAAMTALTEAREAMAAVHAEMDEAKLRLGIRTKLDWQPKYQVTAVETDQTLAEVG